MTDELVDQVCRLLEIDGQYYEDIPTWNDLAIARLRKAGRSAGRQLGWKVRTFAVDMAENTRVWIVVIDAGPEDEARFRERGDLLLREAFKTMDP